MTVVIAAGIVVITATLLHCYKYCKTCQPKVTRRASLARVCQSYYSAASTSAPRPRAVKAAPRFVRGIPAVVEAGLRAMVPSQVSPHDCPTSEELSESKV